MTNAEKYKTARKRDKAYTQYCEDHYCQTCPLRETDIDCRFAWLELETSTSVNEVVGILAKYNAWRRGKGKYAKEGAKCDIKPEEVDVAIDRAVEILRKTK